MSAYIVNFVAITQAIPLGKLQTVSLSESLTHDRRTIPIQTFREKTKENEV